MDYWIGGLLNYRCLFGCSYVWMDYWIFGFVGKSWTIAEREAESAVGLEKWTRER